ncbi:MAG TPA: 5'-3' exonuclease H3TH domain-containing protein [Solirubrobacteraceae bacterium]|jgi:DNA polymerase-1|nr:5'-3' exonuclease H3TH domain-containing protein [Solirubrobacteraceae bacterium]
MPLAPLLIADVPWLLYRAYFGVPRSIVGADGRPVNALLGTVNALLAVLDERSVRAVVACFGAEQAAYRVALYPPYHAHREPMPDELASQWTKAPALLTSLGWTVCDAGELEADDAMFSHARTECEAGGEALLLTADRDLYQAVDEQTSVVKLEKGHIAEEIHPEQVRERYHGVGPDLVPDLIALRGDPSDGLPGAPGVGVKTAAELLLRHGSLEGVLEAAESDDRHTRPRATAALLANAELLRTFKDIATLRRIDVQRPADRPTDFTAGADAANELGMTRLAERLESLATE